MTNNIANNRVLVVDDEIDVCFLLKSILTSAGKEVAVCYSIAECQEKIHSFKPNHIILDINLPDGNGLDALADIKSKTPSLNVIIHSAVNTTQNETLAMDRGAQAFLPKPLNKEMLLNCLRE